MDTKNPLQEQLLSVVRSAKNRLEYLTPNDWVLLVDKAKKHSCKKGDILLQQGKQSKTVYLIVKGTARVEGLFKVLIAQIGPGEICGEMAFLENGVASATVIADGEMETCTIEWAALSDLFDLFPHLGSRFYRSLAVNLSRRLREQIARPGPKEKPEN